MTERFACAPTQALRASFPGGEPSRCGISGGHWLPKNSEVYQFTNDAASTIKQEAEKAIQSMTN